MNGKPIEFINPECELLIKKSDKNKVRQLKDIRYEDGKFRIKVDEQGVTYPGIVTNQLVINDEGRVSTCLFYFMVGTSLDREILQSISKVEVLEQLDEYVVTAFANLKEYEQRIIAGDSAIRKLNDDMIAAEKVRDAAEQKREEFKLLLESKLENGEFIGATGEQGPQGPQGPKGDTPDMTAFEKKINAQYEQINTKVISVEERVQAIEENGVGGGNANIDDTTISKISTWSSEKIEDFVHTNDDVVWSTVQGENLSIEYTKEGYLREVEIWGNTWQDTDSKNLFDGELRQGDISSSDGQDTTSSLRVSSVNFIPVNNSKVLYIYRENANGNFAFRCYDNNKNILGATEPDRTKNSFSLSLLEGTSYVRFIDETNDLTNKYSIAIESITAYEPYHKADLSNIQHLGELYVDESGQPILDGEGREQYKIEVESCSGSLLNLTQMGGVSGNTTVIKSTEIEKHIKGGRYDIVLHGLKPNTDYEVIFDIEIVNGDLNNELLGHIRITDVKVGFEHYPTREGIYSATKYFTTSTTSTPRMYIYSNGGEVRFKNMRFYEKNKSEHNKTTLLLPCQLMKVGDVADRLYWDSEKGKYVVEKNIVNETYKDKTGWGVWYHSEPILRFMITPTNTPVNSSSLKVLTNKILSVGYNINQKNIYIANGKLFLILNDNDLTSNDLNGLNDWLLNETLNVYYQSATPQLIETTILEEIKQPTYKDLTHFFVTGNLDGTLKAKAPLDGGQAIQTLSARNLSLNKEVSTLSLENEEIKEVNNTQDILIDTTMMATDEVYTMLEPILEMIPQTMSLERSVSKMVDMYVAMVQRGLKTIEQVPARYREEVTEILAKLEK